MDFISTKSNWVYYSQFDLSNMFKMTKLFLKYMKKEQDHAHSLHCLKRPGGMNIQTVNKLTFCYFLTRRMILFPNREFGNNWNNIPFAYVQISGSDNMAQVWSVVIMPNSKHIHGCYMVMNGTVYIIKPLDNMRSKNQTTVECSDYLQEGWQTLQK